MNYFEYDALHFSMHYRWVCNGNPETAEFHRNLDLIADENQRAQFCVSLCWRVLADQAVHSHFKGVHEEFENITHYPKMLAHEPARWPEYILTSPVNDRLVTRELLGTHLKPGMLLFAETSCRIFESDFQIIGFAHFSNKLLKEDARIKEWAKAPTEDIRHMLYIALAEGLAAAMNRRARTHDKDTRPPTPKDWIKPELCLAAVTQDGLKLEFVEDQTVEICVAAERQNPQAIQFARLDNPDVARWMMLWTLGQ